MANNLTLQAFHWVEDLSPHPLSYAADERKHHSMEGWASSQDRGHHRIDGTVRIDGTLAARRVTLLKRKDMRVVAIAWSDPATGEYAFEGVMNEVYCVVCDDCGQDYNAAVADWVIPESME